MTTHLVIGDPHASPLTNNDRFDWLSSFIIRRRPDVIVCLGDFGDMPSLCSYDKGTRGFEGRRYKLDIDAVQDALLRTNRGIVRYNLNQKVTKHKQYKPRMIMLGGNHDEGRINKAIENNASILEDIISLDDLMYKGYSWEYHNFGDVVDVDGIAYSHFFISGVLGKPIGGIHAAASLLAKGNCSCTAGHSHVLDYSVRVNAFGERLHGLHAGVFDDNYHEYAGKANDMWWRGLIMKHNVSNGDYDLETISIDRIKEEFENEKV